MIAPRRDISSSPTNVVPPPSPSTLARPPPGLPTPPPPSPVSRRALAQRRRREREKSLRSHHVQRDVQPVPPSRRPPKAFSTVSGLPLRSPIFFSLRMIAPKQGVSPS